MRIVILGLGTAGFAAMLAAKKTNPKADITVIDDKDFDLLHTCGLPYAIEGKIKDFNQLKHDVHTDRMGIRQVKGRVDSIDTKNNKVIVNNMGIEFDKLIISTGTVKFYTSHIYKKLLVSSRTQAVAQARELGILKQ